MWTTRIQLSFCRRRSMARAAASLASLLMVTAVVAGPVEAAGGLVAKRSQYSVTETMSRLERAVAERDLVVVARVDHAVAAQRVGMVLRPTQLLIFGNPKAGTPLMQSAQASASISLSRRSSGRMRRDKSGSPTTIRPGWSPVTT
jgi:hypothetical protein